MAATTREQAAVALYNLVSDASARVVGLQTSSRRLRHPSDVDGSQMPALFQVQVPEKQDHQYVGVPAKRTMHFELWLYTSDPQEDSIVPISQLNAMVQAIEAALSADMMMNPNTLGGLVYSARIDGTVEYYENLTKDGKSIAILPVQVILP